MAAISTARGRTKLRAYLVRAGNQASGRLVLILRLEDAFPEQRRSDESRQHVEAIVSGHVRELFRCLSSLVGFWLRADLKVVELSVFTWPGCKPGRDLHEAVVRSLVELAETHPEAIELMRGRTFARAMH